MTDSTRDPDETAATPTRDEARQLALSQMRGAVWRMQSVEEIEQLLNAIEEALTIAAIGHFGCGINVVDESEPETLVYFYNTAEKEWHEAGATRGAEIVLGFWRGGETVYRPDLTRDDPYDEYEEIERSFNQPVCCIVDVPFSHGTLAVNHTQPHAFDNEDLAFLGELAKILDEGFHRRDDLRDLESAADRADALARAITVVAAATELDTVLQIVVEETARVITSRRVALFLWDEAERALVPRAQVGHVWEALRQVRQRPGEGTSGQVYASGESLIVNGLDTADYPQQLDPRNRALYQRAFTGSDGDQAAAVPLRDEDRVIGTLSIGGRSEPYDQSDLDLLQRLADQAFLAIERTRRTRALEDEVAERRRAEAALQRQQQLRDAEHAVRLKIASMDAPEDLLGVVGEIGVQLQALEVVHDGCSIQVVHADGDDFIAFVEVLNQPDQAKRPDVPSGLSWSPKTTNGADYPWVVDVWKTQQSHYQPRTTGAGDLEPDISLIDVPFTHGTLAINRRAPDAFDAEDIALVERFGAIISEGFQRFIDLAERQQAEEAIRVNLALQRVRNQVLTMESEADWDVVVASFYEELRQLIDFDVCGINIVDLEKGTFQPYNADPDAIGGGETLSSVPHVLQKVMETGAPAYRRNRAEQKAYGGDLTSEKVSVLDVPFIGGTIAINSTREDAFGAREIQILEQFAPVVSESHRRLEDLKRLEESETRLRQSQKLETVGKLAGGIAHDFNNVLTAIIATADQLLLDCPAGDARRPDLDLIADAGRQAAELTQQLLAFSRRQVLQPRVLDLNDALGRQVQIARRLVGGHIQLLTVFSPDLGRAEVDPVQLEQVVLNLVVNARDAMPEGGKLTIATRNADLDEAQAAARPDCRPGAYVVVAVGDTGSGMDAETQERIFEPFFTTKERGEGTGLGLATVYGIVQQSGGHILIDSAPGRGTTFEVYLPRRDDRAEEKARETTSQAMPRGNETVLVVEDEETVRKVVHGALDIAGFAVLETPSAERALDLVAERTEPPDLLLTDIVLTGMDGWRLAEELQARHKNLKVLYMSGYIDSEAAQERVTRSGATFIQKPFTAVDLIRVVRQVLDG